MLWRRFLGRSRQDAESASDLQFYLDTETDDNIARGMPAAEARVAAQYHDPDRIVYLSIENIRQNEQDLNFGQAQFDDLRATAKSFAAIAAYGRPENIALSGIGKPEALRGARVSANFLDVLGVPPVLGRGFLPEEDQRNGRPVAMISAALWERKFGGDPHVTEKAVTLDAAAYSIVGVLPRGFSFPFSGADIWLPRPSDWSVLPARYWGGPILTGFARLKPQVTLEQARAEMRVLYRQYVAAHRNPSNSAPGLDMRTELLKDHLVTRARPMLWTLLGAVAFVLLIACANVPAFCLPALPLAP